MFRTGNLRKERGTMLSVVGRGRAESAVGRGREFCTAPDKQALCQYSGVQDPSINHVTPAIMGVRNAILGILSSN